MTHVCLPRVGGELDPDTDRLHFKRTNKYAQLEVTSVAIDSPKLAAIGLVNATDSQRSELIQLLDDILPKKGDEIGMARGSTMRY